MGLFGASAGGNGGIWGMGSFHHNIQKRSDGKNRTSGNLKSSSSVNATGGAAGNRFPLKQAATAASLALTGDTIAQVYHCWVRNKDIVARSRDFKDIMEVVLSEHDWIRALRMISYGFLLYGPGSYAWYQFLDHSMPKQTVENLLMKVLLNQIVLGPTVIAVFFAWNNLWQGKLVELPNKYKIDALPTLFFGFRFWIPVSILNFWKSIIFSCFQEHYSSINKEIYMLAFLISFIFNKSPSITKRMSVSCIPLVCQLYQEIETLEMTFHINLQDCPPSSPRCFHVHGLNILELLFVLNSEQVNDAELISMDGYGDSFVHQVSVETSFYSSVFFSTSVLYFTKLGGWRLSRQHDS